MRVGTDNLREFEDELDRVFFGRLRIVCAFQNPGCIGTLQEGDPGAPTAPAICVKCIPIERRKIADLRARAQAPASHPREKAACS